MKKITTIDFEGTPVNIFEDDLSLEDHDGCINTYEQKMVINDKLPHTGKLFVFLHEVMEETCPQAPFKPQEHDEIFQPWTKRVFAILMNSGFINKNFLKFSQDKKRSKKK